MSAITPPVERTAPHGALRVRRVWARLRQLSTFEKVIVANSAIILLDTVAGWWITQHNPETYHYVIDTAFIALAALLCLAVNFALLRAAFAPLHSMLGTIRAVERGDLEARAQTDGGNLDVLALAHAFNDMLDRLERTRDETASRVLRAQEDERRRIALELHDETGQSLTALALHAAAIAQRLASEPSDAATQARSHAEHLAALAQRTLGEVQALSRQLRPPLLDDLGLPAALRWLAEDAQERLGVPVTVRVRVCAAVDHAGGETSERDSDDEPPGQRMPTEFETALFRITQESLTNAVRHGRASGVWVALRQGDARVTLTIADNGCGFDPAQSAATGRGLGLEGMRERARLVNGRLAIRSRRGRGCVVRVTAPLTLLMLDRADGANGADGEVS